MNVLWLPSWYPNELEPYSGDFIQRHAKAAATNNKITVIFFTQYGEKIRMDHKISQTLTDNLNEIIVYVPFKPIGLRFIDKLRYNFSFYHFSKKFLRSHFKQNGLPSLVHVHVPMKAGNLALWVKKKFGIPYLLSEHSSSYLQQAPDYFFRRHWFYRLQVKKIFSQASIVTNVSLAIGELLKKLFPINKFKVIYNVVDSQIFKPSALKNEVFTYYHASSLTDQKNIFGILRVFKKLSLISADWKFVIAGPYTDEIVSFIRKEGLENLVHLTGEVPHTTVAHYMRQAHVLVLFSKHENFPCVMIEALCCGLPVVASDIAGIKEAVDDSNGLLVESENEDALLQALIKIRSTYRTYDTESIATGAISKFCYPAITKKFDELYLEALR